MKPYELVPDVSHWQKAIDFAKMASQRIRHVIMKATQGVNFKDPAFERNRLGAETAGLGWIPYHYFVPNLDPIVQARWFAASVPDWSLAADAPVADVEQSTGIPAGYAGKLLQFLTAVEQRTGMRPTIYTRSSYWKLYLSAAVLWADSYRLMVAHYTESSGPLVCAPWDPYNWYMHQFTDRFNGPKYGTTSLQVDMSVVNGSIERAPVTAGLSTADLVYLAWSEEPKVKSQATLADWWAEQRFAWRWNSRKD